MELEFNDGYVRLGSHITKQKSLAESVFRVLSWKINCAQIYLANSRGYSLPKVTDDDISLTRNLVDYACFNVYVHACLLYNLNGGTHIDNIDELIKNAKTEKQHQSFLEEKERIPTSFDKTIYGLITELDICAAAFSTPNTKSGVVVHIGSGAIRDKAIKRIAKTIEKVLSTIQDEKYNPEKRQLILENAAGEGSKIGSTLEDLRDILTLVPKKYLQQISVCIDTCHLFAAGEYNISKVPEMKRFFVDFDKMIGIDKLRLFHLNDSKGEFGCRRDRHEDLGEGYIFGSIEGKNALKYLVNFCNSNRIDMILETPGTHFNDIKIVYDLC